MRIGFLNFSILFLVSLKSYALNLDSLKTEVARFLVTYEDFSIKAEDIENDFFVEIKSLNTIKENSIGIYLFNPINFHGGYSHFLIADKDKFEIINMREPFAGNINKVLIFLEKQEKYNKNETIYYINTFVRIYNNNLKTEGVITNKRDH